MVFWKCHISLKNRPEICKLMLHEFRLGHTASEAARNICTTLRESSTTPQTCSRWLWRFRSGNTRVNDRKRTGGPTIIEKRAPRRAIEQDPSKTMRKFSEKLDVSHMAVARHVHELGKTKKRGQMVPHELFENQKNRHVNDCRWLLHKFSRDGLDRIVTCDEKWVVHDNRKAKNQ